MPIIQTSDGTRLSFRTLGKGPNVLLLHGFGLDGRQWLPFVLPYLHKFRFIIPDLRGHGKSETGPYTRAQGLERLALDIEEASEVLDLKSCRIAAYSMGAFIGLQLLQKSRKFSVENYLHIEAGPRFHKAQDWSLGFNETLMQPACEMVEMWDEALTFSPELKIPRRSFQRLLRHLSSEAFPQIWIKHAFCKMPVALFHAPHLDLRFVHEFFAFLMYEGFDFRSTLARMTVPSLILSGRYSQFFPWQSQLWMHQVLPQSEHRLYCKSGHGLMFSEPLAFRKDFESFLFGPKNLPTT